MCSTASSSVAGEREEIHVSGEISPFVDQDVRAELEQWRPVAGSGRFHQDDRMQVALSGLHQGEEFERLVEGSEAAGARGQMRPTP